MPSCRAISFDVIPRATRRRISLWRGVIRIRVAMKSETAGTCVPAVSAKQRTFCESRRDQPGGSARALERAAIGTAHDLMLEALEKELAAAAWAERLVGIAPRG